MMKTFVNVLTNHTGLDPDIVNALNKASNAYVDFVNKDPNLSPISHTVSTTYVNGYWYVVVSVLLQKEIT